MSTTKTDTQTGQFDPSSMSLFQGLAGALGQTLPGFINNPFGSSQFGLEQQMGTRQAQNLGGTGTSNLVRNMTASGMQGGASSPAGVEMLQNQGRANTGLQANLGFLNPTMNALQRQQYAMGIGSQYRPLQTGQTNVEKTGGLGTWGPQVAGLGLGLLTGMPAGGFNSGNTPGMGQMLGGPTSGQTGAFSGVNANNPWISGGGGMPGFNPGQTPQFPGGGGMPPPPQTWGGFGSY